MILRPYQQEAVEATWKFISTSKGNPIVALPTGTGKSLVIAGFIHRVMQENPLTRVLILTHRKELIQQDFDKLLEFWPQAYAGIYSAGLGRKDIEPPVIFAGVDSIARATQKFLYFDFIIIDECHMVAANEKHRYGKVIKIFQQKKETVRVIGLTATPYRMDSGPLTQHSIFTDICYNLCDMRSFNDLIKQGFLVSLLPYQQDIVYDVSEVKSNKEDYILKELQKIVDTDSYTQKICSDFVNKLVSGKYMKWLIFSSGLRHAKHIQEELSKYNIKTAVVDSNCTNEERKTYIDEFKAGSIRALINYNILTTGFDVPDIDAIVLMRPTKSTVLWVQMLGRGTRPAPNKNHCLVLDYANNTATLGPINDPLIPGQKRKKKGEVPVRLCKNCKAYVHISMKVCPHCDYEFPQIEKLQLKTSTGALVTDGKPKFEWFTIKSMSCKEHVSKAGNNTVLVTYFCEWVQINDYLCFEHTGYPRMRAVHWWRSTGHGVAPNKSADVVKAYKENRLKLPKKIKVWVNKKYPQIMEYVF